MLSLRGLQALAASKSDSDSSDSELDTGVSGTGMPSPSREETSTSTSLPLSEPSSSGQVTTTLTTTTVRKSTSSDTSLNETRSRTTSTGESAGNTTTSTTTFMEGGSPVTTIVMENGDETTSTSTSEDAETETTTVATRTETDSDMDESASTLTAGVPSSIGSTVNGTASANTATERDSVDMSNTDEVTSLSAASSSNSESTEALYKAAATHTTRLSTGSTSNDEGARNATSYLAPSSETSTVSGSGTSTTSFLRRNSSLTSWFHGNFRNDETQLVVGNMPLTSQASASSQVCAGSPALVTRSDSETPNGGCPDELTALNASCTCITGYNDTAFAWTFHVTTESWNSTSTRSLSQSSTDNLAIDTIRPIQVPSSVKSLEIKGVGTTPARISFVNDIRYVSGSSLTLVKKSTNVSTLSIHNVDLNVIAKKRSNFIPATVTELTLHKCNISTLGTSFTRDWNGLHYLDLSSNNLAVEYIGGPNLRELNLSYNALSVFPVGSLNTSGIHALYIEGNDITDFNVSQTVFAQIQQLKAFTADKPTPASACEQGVWQIAHGTTFCVLGVAAASNPDSLPSAISISSDTDGLGALSYWLIAGAIAVFVLLLLIVRQHRRRTQERDGSLLLSPEAIEVVTPKIAGMTAFNYALARKNSSAADPAGGVAAFACYGQPKGSNAESDDFAALSASLSNSAILASCRLDYDEVALGRCISRGGFGFVFVGCYRGRQVAVKKIRNEREITRDQVEQFVCEITLIAGLRHPRIVEFLGACWTTPTELSAVTELMERGDLRDVTQRFKRSGYRLTWETHKTVIAFHIAEALTYLHGLTPTVIHRDLKAKNVLLNADMEAKLSDFGIARERSSYDGSEHMTVGIGTSFWIAPEVLLGRNYDERADIYSFGVVLSEIDTDDYPYWNAHHPPQGKAQENEILRLVARGAKRPSFSENCPPAIYELARRCLRADPAERPSALEIATYLQQLMHESTFSVSFSSTVQPLQSTKSSVHHNALILDNHLNGKKPSDQMTDAHHARLKPASTKAFRQRTITTITPEPAPTFETVVPSSHVTHQVLRTTLPAKVKQTTTTSYRTRQGSSNVATLDETRIQMGGAELIPTSRSQAEAGPTSPASVCTNNVKQHLHGSSSSGKEACSQSSQNIGVGRHKRG